MRARVMGLAAALVVALAATMATSKAMADDKSDAEKCLFRRHYVVGYPGWVSPPPVYYVPRPYYGVSTYTSYTSYTSYSSYNNYYYRRPYYRW